VLKEGLSTLINKMVKDKKLKIVSDKVLNVEYNGKYTIYLMSGRKMYCKKLVIACPPHYWRNWDVAYPFYPLTYSIKSQALNRVYAKFHVFNPDYHYLTSQPIRQLVPVANNISMIAYATDNNASEFLRIKNFWSWVKPQIKSLIGFEPKKPEWIKQNYWSPGTHLWSPNFISKKISNQMLSLPFFKNSLKIIGEAFSLNQGWMEGALQTVETKYKPVNYKKYTIKDVEENGYMVLWGYVYDVTDWIPKHPGGSVINYGLGKDATKMFIRVGHSEQAFQFMEKYRIGIFV
jgi:cytochrome b involved in lipid metabolism